MCKQQHHHASCLCGAVAFEVQGPLRDVICCHCSQCRKMTGHFLAATACRTADLRFINKDGLAWYRSSKTARRGFCKICGSTLFWKKDGAETISIAAGCLERTDGLKTAMHIFCADKGEYYEIPDGAKHYAEWPGKT